MHICNSPWRAEGPNRIYSCSNIVLKSKILWHWQDVEFHHLLVQASASQPPDRYPHRKASLFLVSKWDVVCLFMNWVLQNTQQVTTSGHGALSWSTLPGGVHTTFFRFIIYYTPLHDLILASSSLVGGIVTNGGDLKLLSRLAAALKQNWDFSAKRLSSQTCH